jgi:hypothetical protein
MSKELKQILSEVNRINNLIRFTEKKEILNESVASALKSLRVLVKNSLDDIAKFGIREIDNIVSSMVNSKSVDEFFELLDSIKLHDEGVAKQLRRDIFDILPEVTQKRIIRIVKDIEKNIDQIPEDKIDDLINDIMSEQFPNEPESVRSFLKDSLSDSSSTISNKMGMSSAGSIASRIEDLMSGARKANPGFLDDIPKEAIDERLKQLSKSNPNKYQRHDIEFLERATNGRLPDKPSPLDQQRIKEYMEDIRKMVEEKKDKWYKLNIRQDFKTLRNPKNGWEFAGAFISLGSKLGIPISLPIIFAFFWEKLNWGWTTGYDMITDPVLKDGFTGDWKKDFIKWYNETYPQYNIPPEFYLDNLQLIRVTGEKPNFEVSIYDEDGRTKSYAFKTEDNGANFEKIDL